MTLAERLPLLRVLRYPDFRLLWIGAFVSFTGGQISNVAQGYYVYQLTHDEAMLTLVPFVWSLPILIFGLAAGSFADRFDKRRVLTLTQALFGVTSLYLALGTWFGFITYWQIILIAAINGSVACIEMPTRQSVVSRVVPIEDLAAAVPVNAMTFNIARIFGTGIGGILLSSVGVYACYLIDSISYFALIRSVRAIRSDLSARRAASAPIWDLIREGALYAFRDVRLRTLWLFEIATALFGLSYVALMPAFAQDVLARGNAQEAKAYVAMTGASIGIGAFAGLLLVTQLSASRRKGWIIRSAMAMIALGLLGLSVAREPWQAYPLLVIAGAGGIMQLNTTNALFQTLAPERLHGRVLAMHIWALNGLSPFGVLAFGWLARRTNHVTTLPVAGGVPFAFAIGGLCMLGVLAVSFFARAGLRLLHREIEEEVVPGAKLR